MCRSRLVGAVVWFGGRRLRRLRTRCGGLVALVWTRPAISRWRSRCDKCLVIFYKQHVSRVTAIYSGISHTLAF